MEKFCQSCSMPLELHGQDVRGSEKDGSQSQIYCSYCYVMVHLLNLILHLNKW